MSENLDTKSCGSVIKSVIENGLIASVLSIAHELGILSQLMNSSVPLTSQQIAGEAHLKERYVQEALSSLACYDVIKVSRNTSGELAYHMTSAQTQALQGKDAFFLGTLGTQLSRYPAVKACFHSEGPYGHSTTCDSRRPLDALMMSRVDVAAALIADAEPELREKLDSGIGVVEFGSGGGRLLAALARRFPKSTFTGSEYTTPGTDHLTSFLQSQSLGNTDSRQLDLLHLPDDDVTYDLVLVSLVIHCLADPLAGLRGCHKVLRSGGLLVCIEVNCHSDIIQTINRDDVIQSTTSNDVVDSDIPTLSRHLTAVEYATSTFHCVPQAYQDANSVVLGVCCGREKFSQLIKQAGFSLVSIHPHGQEDIFVLYVCQKL